MTTASVGSTKVSATSGDVTGDTMLTVTDATLVSIEVSPATPSVANGLTKQFTATGLFTDNTTQDITTQVMGLVERRGSDGEQHGRLEWSRDDDICRPHHRVGR